MVECCDVCFFYKQKTAYEIMPSLVGSERCIRGRSICPSEEKERQVSDHSEERSAEDGQSQVTGVVYWNGEKDIYVWLNPSHWKRFKEASPQPSLEEGEKTRKTRIDEPKDRASLKTRPLELCDRLYYSSTDWKDLPRPDDGLQKMILDHFDEQPRNPRSEVAALRRLRSLEKKFTDVEQERLLDHISSQMNSDIPEEIRAEVIRGLRDVDNDRLIECETRPQEFTKYLFLEVVKRRVPKDGGDDDGLVNYEIVGGKVLASKSDRQKRSIDDLESERDSLRIQEKTIYDRMRRLDLALIHI